jgi:hypothetical protein|tara:strand:- start:264 stop:374 length:111 start_codon:yes stop_codon:yes gene_type:complete
MPLLLIHMGPIKSSTLDGIIDEQDYEKKKNDLLGEK